MKTNCFKPRAWGVVILVLCLAGIPSSTRSRAETPPAAPASSAGDLMTPGELPPDVDPNSPLAQVIRLTQAGVDESIIQTFVANSGGTFNLDSDKIIYLRDIGVPNEIIKAMMQRDQQLQQQVAATTYQPPTAPEPDTNTEPAPPPPEDQPAPPPAEVTVNYFYDTLTPYGSWVNVDGYGRCWRPSVVVYNSAWQPYCDHGRWVYTNCGWYWCSDYSWGWAAFHYGRWFQHPHWGWCWVPDTTWGPSWVTWRYSSGYCGWAPLPPFSTYQTGVGFFYRGAAVSVGFNWGLSAACFTFVPTEHFCDPHPHRFCVARAQTQQIFNQTTIINNFNGHGRDLANRGIDPAHITAVTRTPIHPVAFQDVAAPADRGPHGDQLSRDGRTLVVSRPPQAWSPVQNHSSQPTGYRPGLPAQPVQQHPTPVGTGHNPPADSPIRVSPQYPVSPGNYRSPTSPNPAVPNYNRRTDTPRGWEQTQSRGNANYSRPVTTAPAPNPRQSGAPAANPAPAQQQSQHNQHNQPTPAPAPAAPQRSNGQNQNPYGAGNAPGNGPGYGPRH